MSAKTGPQPGRRTPLSLTGGPKQQQSANNKTSSGSNGNSNAHSKNDNKTNNQKTEQAPTTVVELKESGSKELTKKQQNAEKKQQQQQNVAEVSKKSEKLEDKKVQNGVGKANGSAKDKQQNGSGETGANNDKVKEKDKDKDKTEKLDKKERSPLPKEERKEKEQKKQKVIQKELESVSSDNRAEKDAKLGADKKKQEKADESLKNDLSKKTEEKPIIPPTETTPTKTAAEKKTTTPTKVTEKSITPGKAAQNIVSTTPQKIITTAIDDVEMEPLAVEQSPIKKFIDEQASVVTASSSTADNPVASSTPGKIQPNKKRQTSTTVPTAATKSEVQLTMQTTVTPYTYSQISGRRSIRPITDYTPSHFQSNMQFRESYRRINTELDVTSNTNTSLNVTVGSEIPNNSSFSFFGRGRKRDRTPPPKSSQSALELQNDLENSPPKRARLDMYGFFSAVASPISLLRSRFSKTSIQSSTPMKIDSKLAAEDEGEVQNVSGISIEEEILNGDSAVVATTDYDITVGNIADAETHKKITPVKQGDLVKETSLKDIGEKCDPEKAATIDGENVDDIKVTETALADDPLSKTNKRCSIM